MAAELEERLQTTPDADDLKARKRRGRDWFDLSEVNERLKNLAEAEQCFEEAASQLEELSAHVDHASLARIKQAYVVTLLDRPEEALEILDQLIALRDGFPLMETNSLSLPSGLSLWLVLLAVVGDYESLYVAANTAIELLEPTSDARRNAIAEAHVALGTAAAVLGHNDEALQAFNEAIALCEADDTPPKFELALSNALLGLAALLDEMSRPQEAAHAYANILSRFTSYPASWAQSAVETAKDWLAADAN